MQTLQQMENERRLSCEEDVIWHTVEEVTQYQHVYAIPISVRGKERLFRLTKFLLKKAIYCT